MTLRRAGTPSRSAGFMPSRTALRAWVQWGRGSLARWRTMATHALVLRDLAPRRGEIIDVDPRQVAGSFNSRATQIVRRRCGYLVGVVVDGDWDLEATYGPFTEKLVYKACHMRWVGGSAWEETELFQLYAGWIERGEPCRFKTYGDLVARYRALDGVFEQVRRDGALSESPEHLVCMSVVRDGRLLWGPNGRHRVAIAMIAGVPTMPASVGYVHRDAVSHFQRLRRELPRALR